MSGGADVGVSVDVNVLRHARVRRRACRRDRQRRLRVGHLSPLVSYLQTTAASSWSFGVVVASFVAATSSLAHSTSSLQLVLAMGDRDRLDS